MSIQQGRVGSVFAGMVVALGCSASGDDGDTQNDLMNEGAGAGGVAQTVGSGGLASSSSSGGYAPVTATGGSSFMGSGGSSSPPTPGASGGSVGLGGSPPAGLGGGSPTGMGGSPPAGMGGSPPAGMGGSPPAGMGGSPPAGMGGGMATGTGGGGAMGTGKCCSGGDCLCHGDPPASLSARRGPFRSATVPMRAGTAHYPTDAEPPFAGVAICPGFLNSGPEMTAWGAFYASWGIVTVVTNTLPTDFPDIRGGKLLAAVEELKTLNSGSSPLSGKLAGRYGTSGYSMGGGGTTIATARDKTLKSSVGLAAWGPTGLGVQTPTLFFCGDIDIVAPCGGSQGTYNAIPNTVPKMLISLPLSDHLAWFGPNDTSGGWGLAFEKVFLEGDERWKPLLTKKPLAGQFMTNIQ